MKNIYIASSTSYIKDGILDDIAKFIEDMGFLITRKWWKFIFKDSLPGFNSLSEEQFYYHPLVNMIRECDFKAVKDADVVIAYAEDGYKLDGGNIELGYAHALNKTIILLGSHKWSAMKSSFIRVRDKSGLGAVLSQMHLNKLNRW